MSSVLDFTAVAWNWFLLLLYCTATRLFTVTDLYYILYVPPVWVSCCNGLSPWSAFVNLKEPCSDEDMMSCELVGLEEPDFSV